MGKFSHILFVSDFDRTLTNSVDRVVEENVKAIEYFISEGGKFTVCTGRSHHMFRSKAPLVPTNAPLIMTNGAVSYDYGTETALFVHPAPPSAKQAAADIMANFPDARVELQCMQGHFVFGEDTARDQFMRDAGTPILRAPLDEVPEPILKIAVIGSVIKHATGHIDLFAKCSDDENRYYNRIIEFVTSMPYGGEFEVLRTAPRIVELQKKGATKGAAARELAEKLGRSVLVCAGDALNDLSMLREADVSFAPASASPEILKEDVITVAHCDDGAVASAIRLLDETESLLV